LPSEEWGGTARKKNKMFSDEKMEASIRTTGGEKEPRPQWERGAGDVREGNPKEGEKGRG